MVFEACDVSPRMHALPPTSRESRLEDLTCPNSVMNRILDCYHLRQVHLVLFNLKFSTNSCKTV